MIRIGSIFSIISLLLLAVVLAANDPGHDQLYIEQQGDSSLNGTLNITQNLSVEGGRTYEGSKLTLYGDGTTLSTVSEGYISGDLSNNVFLDGQGSVFIKTISGADMVYIGKSTITPTDLNISGALYFGGINKLSTSAVANASDSDLYWGDKLVCDASEVNCGWGASTAAGDGNNYTTNVFCDGNGTTNHICTLEIVGRDNVSWSFTGYNATGSGGDGTGGWINTSINTTFQTLTIRNQSGNTDLNFLTNNMSISDGGDAILLITQANNVQINNGKLSINEGLANIPNAVLDVGVGIRNNNSGTANVINLDTDISNPILSLGFYQNFLLQTEVMGTTWVSYNLTQQINSVMSPIGTIIAERLMPTTDNASIGQTITNATLTNWTFSVWLKTPNTTEVTVNMMIDTNSTNGTHKPVVLTNAWKRYSITENTNSIHANVTVKIDLGNVTMDMWGAQLEPTNWTRPYSGARTTPGLVALTGTTLLRSALSVTGAITSSGVITGVGVAVGGTLTTASTGAFSGIITQTTNPLFVSTDGLVLTSTTATTQAIPIQLSPRLRFTGVVWDNSSGASRTVNFKQEVIPISSSTGSAKMVWGYGYNSVTDVGMNQLMSLGSVGTLDVLGNTFSEQVLANMNFTGSDTGWGTSGGWLINTTTNMSRYQFSLGANGNLTQNSTSYLISVKPNRWYKLSYNVSGTGVAGCLAFVNNIFSTENVYLPGVSVVTAGQLYDINIKTNSNPGNFTITARCTAGSFYLDTLSLSEFVSGDIIANGQLTGGGTNGIKIMGDGKVGISTIDPTEKLDVNGTINANQIMINGTPVSTGTADGNNYTTGISISNNGSNTHIITINRNSATDIGATFREDVDQNNYTTDAFCDGNGTTNHICTLDIEGRNDIHFSWTGYNTTAGGDASTRVLNATFDAVELAQNTSFDLRISGRILNGTIPPGMGSSNVTEAYVNNKITNGTILAGYGSSNVTEAYVNNKITNGTLPPDQNNYTTGILCDGNLTTNHICNITINGRSTISFGFTNSNQSLAGYGSSNVTEAYANNKITNGTVYLITQLDLRTLGMNNTISAADSSAQAKMDNTTYNAQQLVQNNTITAVHNMAQMKALNTTVITNQSSANLYTLNASRGIRVGTNGTDNVIQALNITGNVNIESKNITSIHCIIFDNGGKICTGT